MCVYIVLINKMNCPHACIFCLISVRACLCMDFLLTALLHSGHKAGQRDLWGQLDHWRRRRRSHRHWSSNTQRGGHSGIETERAMEVVDREKDNDKRIAKRCRGGDKVQNQGKGKRVGGERKNKKLVSERNGAGSIAEQLIYTFPISVLLCCVFSSGAKEAFISI